MRRAQSNSPRVPPKKYHSFKETRDADLDNLLLLPGYKPRPRPPSFPAHISPTRDHPHVPRIRVTCVPDPEPEPDPPRPVMRRQSPEPRVPSSESRGRTPGRRVSRRINRYSLFSTSCLPPAVCPSWPTNPGCWSHLPFIYLTGPTHQLTLGCKNY